MGCCEGELGGLHYGRLLLLYIEPIWVMSYEVRVFFLWLGWYIGFVIVVAGAFGW